jgi:glycosyltransferase involved in cell wall biosynthesis
MKEPAAVSVIIPAYNCEQYVAEALDSVFAQTLYPHEIFVVDDGSTDGTRRVLDAYIPQIIYVYQHNRGAAAARNNAIRRATGDFIAFLDADDLWLPEMLASQIDCFRKHPTCGLVYTDMKMFDASGIIHESVRDWLGMSMPVGYVFPELFWETLFCPSSVLCRRECFDEVGLFDDTLRHGDDYQMWLRIARRFELGCVDKPLMMYRQHPEMLTRRVGQKLINGMPWETRILRSVLDLHPEIIEELGERTVCRRLAKPYFYLACGAIASGEHRQARFLLREALRGWPSNLRYVLLYLATFFSPPQVAMIRNTYHRLQHLSL